MVGRRGKKTDLPPLQRIIEVRRNRRDVSAVCLFMWCLDLYSFAAA
jgi:hypothetical protein